MPGLLDGVLPYAYSQGDRAKRYLNGLLSDPIGTAQQAAGQLSDNRNYLSGLLDQALANKQRPFQVTDNNALTQAANSTLSGLLGFAPVGMTKIAHPDWLGELQSVGGRMNPDGTVTVFHRTTPQAADAIRRTGKMGAKEDGLFFSSAPDGPNSAGYGQGVVKMNVPASKLQLDDLFDTEAHFRLPLQRAGQVLDVTPWLAE